MIKYYLYKAVHKGASLVSYASRGRHPEGGVFEIIPRNFKFGGKVVLAFWDTKLVHLGDQLFHEALIRYLVKNNIEVLTVGDSWLNKYFQALGAKNISFENLKKEDTQGTIFISKDDLGYQFLSNFRHGNAFLGIDYAALKSQEKVNLAILRIFLDLLEKIDAIKSVTEEIQKINPAPEVPKEILSGYENADWLKNIANQNQKFLAFNNYLASGFLEASVRKRILENLARQKKQAGWAIIHLGSPKEKANDRKKYDFIDYDLRGKLQPLDLIKLFSLENVKGIISFDTYAMHAASLCQKDLHIVVKNARRKKEIEQRFVPFFPAPNLVKTLK